MATLTAGQKTKLRDTTHRTTVYMSPIVPTTLLSARVDDGSAARGQRAIPFDTGVGAMTYVEGLQELWVGTTSGGHDVGRALVRSTSGGPTTGTINVYENAIVWQDNLHLTIKHYYPIDIIPPRIASTIFYKWYDTGYTDENETSGLLPVCVAGPDQVGKLDSTPELYFSFDLSDSYAMAPGKSISSYALAVAPTAGTVVDFNTGTGIGTIKVTTPGNFWATATCTDSNGNPQVRKVLLRAHNAADPPLSNFTLNSLDMRWPSGGVASATVHEDENLDQDSLPDGMIVLLWYEVGYGADTDYVNVLGVGDNLLMAAYLRKDAAAEDFDAGDTGVRLELTTVDGLLTNKPMRGIGLRAMSVPAEWWEFGPDLTTGRAIHHLFRWHSTVPWRHDLIGLTSNTQTRRAADMEEGTLFQMANSVSWDRGIFAKVVCDRVGRIHLVVDSQMLGTSGLRDALDTVFSVDEKDCTGVVSIAREPEAKHYTGQLSGFFYDSLSVATAYVALIPGYREGGESYGLPNSTGSSLVNLQKQLLISQADANQKVGRAFAAANMEIKEIRISLRDNYMGAFSIIPSLGWYTLGFGADTLNRSPELVGIKMLCRSFSIQGIEDGVLQMSVIFEPEAEGPDGIQGNYPTSMPIPPEPEDPRWDIDEEEYLGAVLAVGGEVAYIDDNDIDWLMVQSPAEMTYLGGTIDAYWKEKLLTSNPLSTIWWATGFGAFRADTEIGEDDPPNDMTPSNSPANTWSDSPAPTTSVLSVLHPVSDKFVSNGFYTIGRWANGTAEYRGWYAVSADGGFTWSWLPLYDGGGVPDEIYPIQMAVNGTYILVTVWEKDGATVKLKLQVYTKSTLTWLEEHDLGVASWADFDAGELTAFPVTVEDDDDVWFVGGRMISPVGLSGTHHVVKTANGGTSWSNVENSWTTYVCLGFVVGNDSGGNRNYYGVRSGS